MNSREFLEQLVVSGELSKLLEMGVLSHDDARRILAALGLCKPERVINLDNDAQAKAVAE